MNVKAISFKHLALVGALLALPGLAAAVDNVKARYAGAAGGDWSGQGKFVTGPADGKCSNMGAVDKQNLAYEFNFNVPAGATITGLTAAIKAAAKGGQNVGVQLMSDPAGPALLGKQRTIAVTAADAGNCAETAVTEVNGTLANWGPPAVNLTPAIVNDPGFGVVFTKLEQSEVKVDAVCLEVEYTTTSGPATQESCFETPQTSITVIKDVLGAVPGSDWNFSYTSPGGGGSFPLPAAGGSKVFMDLGAGSYTITETDAKGYTASVSCTNGQSGSTSVTFDLEIGQSVSCTFTNTAPTPPASITVRKVLSAGSIPPDEDWFFSFAGDEFFLGAGGQQTFPGLKPGTYNVAEIDALGYAVSVSCTNGQSGGSNVAVNVGSGDDVTCIFTNTKRPEAVPTMSAVGLGALALMLAAAARRRMR